MLTLPRVPTFSSSLCSSHLFLPHVLPQVARDGDGDPITHAQQCWVLQLPAGSTPEFVWIGDRWGSALVRFVANSFGNCGKFLEYRVPCSTALLPLSLDLPNIQLESCAFGDVPLVANCLFHQLPIYFPLNPCFGLKREGIAQDGFQGHDFTYWQPIDFAADGSIKQFGWVDEVQITVAGGRP